MHRNKLYKRIALVVIFVLSISAAVIYFTFDIRALDYLTMFSSWSVLCALGALAIGLFFDGTRLLTLARITGEDLPLPDVVKVVLSNYFLAVLTPGATGGAIAQVMFMRRAGVSVARSTVIILVRTIMSIFFLIVMLPIFMKQDEAITSWVPMPVIMTVSVIFIAIPVRNGLSTISPGIFGMNVGARRSACTMISARRSISWGNSLSWCCGRLSSQASA